MNRFTIAICLFTLSCNSRPANNTLVVDNTIKEPIPIYEPLIDTQKPLRPAIILDTLVFDRNVNGEILLNKLRTNQSELSYYKDFIDSKSINKLKIIKDKHTKTEIKYLGKLNDLDKENIYDVITNFTIMGIGQMLSPRGNSKIIFINKDRIIIYQMSMPYELPKYIQKNILYFKSKETKVGISIFGGLPTMLCVPEIGCY